MISLNKTEELLLKNSIDADAFDDKLYQTLLLGVFEALCKDILKSNAKVSERKEFIKFKNKTTAAKNLVSRYIGCELTEDGYARMGVLLSAFFSADDHRIQFDESYREKLLRQQNGRCAICNKKIDISSHLDHIIPFHYVGDSLKDNYQMLCETCNTRKGDSTYFELSMLLLNRG